MMTPLRSVRGGGDQENTTSLSPGTTSILGDPDGAEKECEEIRNLNTFLNITGSWHR